MFIEARHIIRQWHPDISDGSTHRIIMFLTIQMRARRMVLFHKEGAMAFEEFKHKKTRGVFEPRVSISNVGLFILNSGCMTQYFREFDEEEQIYAVLFWDKQSQKIGIKPTKQKLDHRYKVNKKESIGTLSATGFLAHYRLKDLIPAKREKPNTYDAEWNDELGLLEFSVKKKVVSIEE